MTGFASAVLTFSAGCFSYPKNAKADFSKDVNAFSISNYLKPSEKKEQSRCETGRGLWERAINRDGILITPEFLKNYPAYADVEEFNNSRLSQEKITHLNNLLKIIFEDCKRFGEEAIPQNYTEMIFLERYDAIQKFSAFIQPSKTAEIIGLNEKNPLYLELKDNLFEDDYKKIPEILYCAKLLVHKKLEAEAMLSDLGSETFFENLSEGKGDCSDYSFAIANTYYKLCEMLDRNDLLDKIRVTIGMFVSQGKPGLGHAWIDYVWYENGKSEWKSAEVTNSDFINKNDNPKLSPILFYVYDSEEKFLVPLISMRNSFEGSFYKHSYFAHVLPVVRGDIK